MAGKDINEIVGSLGKMLAKHPLFQHKGPAGLSVIHADWPAYPTGDGLACAVSSLAEFPQGTRFYPMDFIDRCTLFAVDRIPQKKGKCNRSPLLNLAELPRGESRIL